MTIDQKSRHLWQTIALTQKAAFFSCFVTGYLVHLYAFTNLIPNSDGLSRVFDLQQMTISGRWFLHYASALNEFTQMPAVIGFFSILFLSFAAAFVVDLLSIRSSILAGFVGVVMAAFPCLGYTFLYLFTASAYCLAILLAVLSVWLACRGKVGWLLGVLALALSMGTYQAYATVAISLSLLCVFREALNPDASFRPTLYLGLRLVAYLAAGAAVYYGILLVVLRWKDLELLSYLGMDAASSGFPFSQLPSLLLETYKQVVAFFFLPGSPNGFSSTLMVTLDLVALLLGAYCLFRCLRQGGLWKESWRVVGTLGLLALLPLGVNFMQILSPYSQPTPLMKYAHVAVYLTVLLVVDIVDRSTPHRGLAPATALWVTVLFLFSLNTNNLLYSASAQAHRATESYITRLLSRIESCPGYQPDMEVAIIGTIPAQQIYSQIPSYTRIDHYSVPLNTVVPLNKHLYYYLNHWLNVPIEEPEEQTMLDLSQSQAFQEMPLYPADGSVAILDGRVVVKLQEEYTPKSDYEIAYENRR
ncbi:MAG: glucosyltransferase domain-containing protein [Lawsonibacter sp.]|jgi:hypothetical protein